VLWLVSVIQLHAAILEPGLILATTDEPTQSSGNNVEDEDDSSSGSSVIIAVSVVVSLLALGVIGFLVVLFLFIRHKCKARIYTTTMVPDKVFYNCNRYVPSQYCVSWMSLIHVQSNLSKNMLRTYV